MSTLTTTLSPTEASQTEILARHLFDEERTAENADLDLEQYIQKLDGLHEGEGCLLNPVSVIANARNASIGSDDNECPDGKLSTEPIR
jgi:hypothetical protein